MTCALRLCGLSVGNEGFQALLQRRTVKHDVTPAGQTAQADIGAEARYYPVVGAAGVRLAQSQDVAQVQV